MSKDFLQFKGFHVTQVCLTLEPVPEATGSHSLLRCQQLEVPSNESCVSHLSRQVPVCVAGSHRGTKPRVRKRQVGSSEKHQRLDDYMSGNLFIHSPKRGIMNTIKARILESDRTGLKSWLCQLNNTM